MSTTTAPIRIKTMPRPLLTIQVELEKKRAVSLPSRAELREDTFCSFASYFIFAVPRFAVAVLINVADRIAYTAANGTSMTSIPSASGPISPVAPAPIQ